MQTTTASPSIADTATYTARTIGQDVAIYVDDSTILVSSVSKPGTYRLVNLIEGTCTCEAAVLGGYDHCHHRTTARTCAEIERREAKPVPIETALTTLTTDPRPEIAELAAEILKELEASRPELTSCERRALAKSKATVRVERNAAIAKAMTAYEPGAEFAPNN